MAKLLCEFENVFMSPDGGLGLTKLVKHRIDTGDNAPIKQPPRRLPIAKRDEVEKEVTKMLEQGIIEESDSPWASPVVLVTKKDGSTRFCVDYRKLNEITRKDAYPLPRIDDSLDSLSGASWFCTLDFASGFHQVTNDEKDCQKTAFVTRKGLYQFKVMPFGLTNAPATFERLMELVLRGLQWEKCLVYIDDVIVFGKGFDETLDNLREVLNRFKGENLKLKPKKCHLFRKSVTFLGHLVTADGIMCDPEKVEAVRDWPRPSNVNEVRSFLGLASYYHRFIPQFITVAPPLTNLTKLKVKYNWSDSCEESFSRLKQLLVSSLVLAYPNGSGKFLLDTDTGDYGIGVDLSQIQWDDEKVTAYASKTLSKTQRNYCTTKKELLAVVTFAKQFKHYLYGRKFLIRTDHASLRWLKNFKDVEGMLARWLSVLDTFDYEMEHRKGSNHTNAYALSRKPARKCRREDCPGCSESVNVVRGAGVGTSSMLVTSNGDNPSSEVNLESNSGEWLDSWDPSELKDLQQNDSDIKKGC